MPINLVVIDDEASARFLMTELISVTKDTVLAGIASDAMEGFKMITKLKPDIAFVDINMPGHSGLELAELVMQHKLKTRVVFVTAYNEYYLQAIRAAAYDYLLKPVDPDELEAVLSRFRADITDQAGNLPENSGASRTFNLVRLNVRTGFLLVDPSDIVIIKADGNYAEIYMVNHDKVVVSQPIGHFNATLPSGSFFRCSRSVLFNLKYLREVDRKNHRITLRAGEFVHQVCVSRKHLQELDERTR